MNLSASDLERIGDVLVHAWAESTRETYGSGLLAFHVFCDARGISERDRSPATHILLSAFISAMAGAYSGKTIANYLYGVRAWHILHGSPWHLNEMEMDALLKAAVSVTPPSSKRKKRHPYTTEFITSILGQLIPTDPFDAAVASCLTTIFYTAARTGEFTVRTLTSFNPASHVKPSDVTQIADRNGLETTNFHIPCTKASLEGEDVYWARQNGPTDPESAWANHVRVNSPPPDGHLFAFRFKKGYRPMTRSKFLSRLTAAAVSAGLNPIQSHGIRIGATLEYLLRGIPFDVVKVKGRWSSEAFTLYLTKHAQILAPYMQAVPAVHETLIRLTMPPVR
jgi:hypothetical protein